jgi:hypothetical protein
MGSSLSVPRQRQECSPNRASAAEHCSAVELFKPPQWQWFMYIFADNDGVISNGAHAPNLPSRSTGKTFQLPLIVEEPNG